MPDPLPQNKEGQPSYSAPFCQRCSMPMIARIASRGKNAGRHFWGCSNFPKCRFKITGQATEFKAAENRSREADFQNQDALKQKSTKSWVGKAQNFVSGLIDGIKHQKLGSYEPDGYGRWSPPQRLEILKYLHSRDAGCCGLCGVFVQDISMKGIQIEHIIPKMFAFFDVTKNLEAVQGSYWESFLHKVDNLQIAHSYCNRAKGNTSKLIKWRHPRLPRVRVAQAQNETLLLPLLPSN